MKRVGKQSIEYPSMNSNKYPSLPYPKIFSPMDVACESNKINKRYTKLI